MSETTSEASAPPDEGERLDRVEDKLDALAAAVAKLVPGSHAEAEKRTEGRLDRASSVEEAVQAELEKRDRLEAEKRAKETERAEGESMKERLARLEEKPPAPPRSRKTAALGWGDGRS